MKVFLRCFTVSALLIGSCHSMDVSQDPYTVKFTSQVTSDQINSALASKVKARTLDLGSQNWVDDNFIKELSAIEMAKKIINLDISGTKITGEGLNHILSSTLGSTRDILAISEKHDCPASEIHLNVSSTLVAENVKNYSNPVENTLFENLSNRYVKGIKTLRLAS